MKRFPKLFSLSFAALAAFSIGNADAALVFDLNDDACTGGCGPAGTSFGTVTLTQVDADTVHVDVDLSPTGVSFFIDTGAGYALTWNGPSGETIENVNPPLGFNFLPYNDPATPPTGYDTGGNFGSFNYAIECEAAPKGSDAATTAMYCASQPGGGGGQHSALSFDVNLSPALLVTDFTGTNPQGFYFSVDLIGPSGNTGVVAANTFTNQPDCIPGSPNCSPDTNVPEPSTLALLGATLLAGVGARKRRGSPGA
jgi:hypothetical protein